MRWLKSSKLRCSESSVGSSKCTSDKNLLPRHPKSHRCSAATFQNYTSGWCRSCSLAQLPRSNASLQDIASRSDSSSPSDNKRERNLREFYRCYAAKSRNRSSDNFRSLQLRFRCRKSSCRHIYSKLRLDTSSDLRDKFHLQTYMFPTSQYHHLRMNNRKQLFEDNQLWWNQLLTANRTGWTAQIAVVLLDTVLLRLFVAEAFRTIDMRALDSSVGTNAPGTARRRRVGPFAVVNYLILVETSVGIFIFQLGAFETVGREPVLSRQKNKSKITVMGNVWWLTHNLLLRHVSINIFIRESLTFSHDLLLIHISLPT